MITKTQQHTLTIGAILVLLICFGTSCNRSANQNVEAKYLEVSQSSTEEKPWVDPLFFIEGQLCQHLRQIFQDSQGNLWMGTNVYGLMRYNGDSLIYFDENHGLGAGRITGIVEDEEGNVWFGTASGLSKYNASANSGSDLFENFDRSDGLLDDEVWSLMIDDAGLMWIGTIDGVYQYDGQRFKKFEMPKAVVMDTSSILSFDRVSQIIQDRNGTMWFGTDGFGITCFNKKTGFQHYTITDGLPDNNIHSLLEDSRGDIWIGTMHGGLARWSNSNFIKYPFGDPIWGLEIGALYEDHRSNIWFASENHGVYQYDAMNEAFTHFDKGQGLLTGGILSMYEDTSGQFWLGGWGGLFRYFPDEKDSTRLFSTVTKEGPWD